MFSIPQAKRVRREELYSPTSSPCSSPDPSLTELFHSRVQQDYSYDSVSIYPPSDNNGTDKVPVEEDEELEFRLFAAPLTAAPQSQAPTQKIRLRSPSVGDRAPGFVNPSRDPSYYFTGEIGRARRAELDAVAVEGEDILQRAQTSWPGCALPWRVATITPAGLRLGVSSSNLDSALALRFRRTRPGKKHRVALRKKAQKIQEKKEQAERALQEKIEAEKEKRTRRNREKKVKKRAKEKAKKAGLDAGDSRDGVIDVGVS